MTEELLQDLALYKKSHEKAVSIAARSLIGLFREVSLSHLCLLVSLPIDIFMINLGNLFIILTYRFALHC